MKKTSNFKAWFGKKNQPLSAFLSSFLVEKTYPAESWEEFIQETDELQINKKISAYFQQRNDETMVIMLWNVKSLFVSARIQRYLSWLESQFRKSAVRLLVEISNSFEAVASVLDLLFLKFDDPQVFFYLLFNIYPLSIPFEEMTFRDALDWQQKVFLLVHPKDENYVTSLVENVITGSQRESLDQLIFPEEEMNACYQRAKRMLRDLKKTAMMDHRSTQVCGSMKELNYHVCAILKWRLLVVRMNPIQ
jgi:hypothetical protein